MSDANIKKLAKCMDDAEDILSKKECISLHKNASIILEKMPDSVLVNLLLI